MSSESLDTDVKQKLKQGIGLARDNQRQEAEAVFAQILELQPRNETALIWKAAVAQNPAEAVRCLEQALQVNSANQRARAGLEWAQRRLQASKITQFPDKASATGDEPPSISVSVRQPSHLVNNLSQAKISELPLPLASPLSTVSVAKPKPVEANASAEKPSQIAAKSVLNNRGANLSETLDPTPPYKKSRFKAKEAQNNTLRPASTKAVTFTPLPAPARANGGRGFGSGRGKRRSKLQSEASRSIMTTPSPSLSLSAKVQQQDFGSETEQSHTGRGRLVIPLALFVVAIILGVLSLPLASLSQILGVIAVVMALAGIILFNRAEF